MTISTDLAKLQDIVSAAVKAEVGKLALQIDEYENRPGLNWMGYLIPFVVGLALGAWIG